MKAVQVQPVAEQWITQRTDRTHTGILLGQSWDQRVYILSAISTPALPKSSGGAGWNRVDWFQEHARQVRRMLVGGVEIVGMFVADSNAERAKSFESEAKDMIYGLPVSATSVDRILLRAGAGGKGLSGESYTGAKKDAIKPKPLTGIKVQPVTPNLVAFESTLYLDVSIPVQPASSAGGVPLKQQLRRGLEAWQASVMAAQASINGAAVDGSIVIEKAFAEGGSSAGKGKGGKGKGKSSSSSSSSSADSADASANLVEFFLRPTPLPAADSTATGVVRLHGSCHCRVYAHNKYTVAQSLLALKHDVINSLQSRLQLLCEDSEDAIGAFDLPAADESSFVWQLPRRLFQPLARPACVCDYLLSHESADDGVRRIAELLSVDNLKEQGGEPFTREECAEEEEAATAAGKPNNADTKAETSSSSNSSSANSSTAGASSSAAPTVATTATPAAANPLIIIAMIVLAIALFAAFVAQG